MGKRKGKGSAQQIRRAVMVLVETTQQQIRSRL